MKFVLFIFAILLWTSICEAQKTEIPMHVPDGLIEGFNSGLPKVGSHRKVLEVSVVKRLERDAYGDDENSFIGIFRLACGSATSRVKSINVQFIANDAMLAHTMLLNDRRSVVRVVTELETTRDKTLVKGFVTEVMRLGNRICLNGFSKGEYVALFLQFESDQTNGTFAYKLIDERSFRQLAAR
jgi:hypothetical protein